MPKLFIIDDEWSELSWYSTGGTRAKKYLLGPDGKYYYFKRSQFKPPNGGLGGKDYKYEFWSEVIAYEIGKSLGFNVLKYDIAIDGQNMGCISESMIDSERQELVEGVKYLQAYMPEFDPAVRGNKKLYDFHLIANALEGARIETLSLEPLLELIVFDALIGNGDRHQENWAIIETRKLQSEVLKREIEQSSQEWDIMDRIRNFLSHSLRRVEQWAIQKGYLTREYYEFDHSFAPLYDNGSSLGRELTDERVAQLLSSPRDLNDYVERGKSEIHWQQLKLSHFNLIRKLLETEHEKSLQNIVRALTRRFNPGEWADLVQKVDRNVPEDFAHFRIPDSRKELIFRVISLRFEKIQDCLHA